MSPIPFARPLSLAAAALVLSACADAETPLLNAGRAPSVASVVTRLDLKGFGLRVRFIATKRQKKAQIC